MSKAQQNNRYVLRPRLGQLDSLIIILEPVIKSNEYTYYETIITDQIFKSSGLDLIFKPEELICYLAEAGSYTYDLQNLLLQIVLPKVRQRYRGVFQLFLTSKVKKFKQNLQQIINKCKSQKNLTQSQAKQFILNISQYILKKIQKQSKEQKQKYQQIDQLKQYIQKTREQCALIKEQLSQKKQIKQQIKYKDQSNKQVHMQDFQDYFQKFQNQQEFKFKQHKNKINLIISKMEDKLNDYLRKTNNDIQKLRIRLNNIEKDIKFICNSGKKIQKIFQQQKQRQRTQIATNKISKQKQKKQRNQIQQQKNMEQIQNSDQDFCIIHTIHTSKYKKTLLKQGQIRLDFVDGSYYVGQIENEVYNGKGFYWGSDGISYEGSWLNGKHHGFGVKIDDVGTKSTGIYVDGMRFGQGIDYYANGDLYKGNFQNDMKSGYGTYTFNDGSSYKGDWKMNKYHGSGLQINVDGSRYEGLWQNDEKHGQGILYEEYIQIRQYWDDGKLISQQYIEKHNNRQKLFKGSG